MLNTEVMIGCDKAGCKKAITATTRKEAKVAARKAGWLVKGTKSHLCADHRPAVKSKKVTVSSLAKKIGIGKKKVSKKPKTLKATKKSGNVISFTSSTPVPGNDNPN